MTGDDNSTAGSYAVHRREPLIRQARPEDADFLAEAMLAASRGHLARGWYDIAVDEPEDRCLAFLKRVATADAPSWWHYSHFLIAEVDGEPAAALAAFRAGDAYALSGVAMAEAVAALGLTEADQSAIWTRGSYLFLCTLGDDDSWTLENIYTAPRHRGQGLVGRLLDRAVAEGFARGFETVQVTFFIGNDAAERAYRKSGFAFADEKYNPEFEAVAGAPGLRRLVRCR